MDLKKIFLYIASLVLLVKGGKTIWELINFNQINELNDIAHSIAYKIGFVVGMIIEVIVFFGLIKIIYDYFLKNKKLTSNSMN